MPIGQIVHTHNRQAHNNPCLDNVNHGSEAANTGCANAAYGQELGCTTVTSTDCSCSHKPPA
jgi:hypothetical protein